MMAAGVQKLENEKDEHKTIVHLQQRACSFKSLIEVFGPGMTLQKLADLEKAYAR